MCKKIMRGLSVAKGKHKVLITKLLVKGMLRISKRVNMYLKEKKPQLFKFMKENPIFPQDTSLNLNTSSDRQHISLRLFNNHILQPLNTISAHNTLVQFRSKSTKSIYHMNKVQATINFISRIFPNHFKVKQIHLQIIHTLIMKVVTEELSQEIRVILKDNTEPNDNQISVFNSFIFY